MSPLNQHASFTLEPNGRLTLTEAFASAMPSRIILSQVGRKWIRIFSSAEFEEFKQETFGPFSRNNQSALDLAAVLAASAHEVKVDASRRMIIPSVMRATMGMERECGFIATGREFLVVTKEVYEQFLDDPFEFRADFRAKFNALREQCFQEELSLRRYADSGLMGMDEVPK